jgi:hypothetical protein
MISTLHSEASLEVPLSVRRILLLAFALLWAIWIQPHTIGLRHILLTVGSVLGLYIISKNYRLLLTRSAIPIYLIGLLFIWITFHLFFLSNNYALQLGEYLTIWKRIAWGTPFAIGLGISLTAGLRDQNSSLVGKSVKDIASGVDWWIFYTGMMMPTIIYLLRASLMTLAPQLGWQLPDVLQNLYPPSTWYIPKTGYVFFCFPALVIAGAQLIQTIGREKTAPFKIQLFYLVCILGVTFVFYSENIKNGMAYTTLILVLLFIKAIFNSKKQMNKRPLLMLIIVAIAMSFLISKHFEKNNSWKTLFPDIKVAEKLNQIDSWKYYGEKGYPTNELGAVVSQTNYERAAWGQVALGFIQEMPLGYGLVHESFGHRAREKWPDSKLLQSHSGWLDLTLGIGLPGVALILLAGIFALKNIYCANAGFWRGISSWLLLSITLLMVTTEVSQEIYVDALIFLILWVGAMGLRSHSDTAV